MLRHRLIAAAAGLAVVCAPAFGQAQRFHQQFNAVLAQHGIVGGAVAIVRRGQPATEFFYGVQKQGTPQAIDAETTYNWASITKTMTAIAILQLRDRGQLKLDDAAVKYVPELRAVHDGFGPVEAITIRDLLTHSAGFRNPTWPWNCDDAANCDWQPFEPTRWGQVAAMLPYTNVAFRPGTRWSYSNLGYVFLGQVIERLTDQSFVEYLTKNILMPLGMTRSYFDQSPYYLERQVSASYVRAGGKLAAQPFDFDTGITTSNSGLKAPMVDMEKYLRFLIGDGGDAEVLQRSSLEEAWRGILPVTEDGTSEGPYVEGQPRMGLGFFLLDGKGRRYVYHDGDQGGFSSEMIFDPERGVGSLLMVNTTDEGVPATGVPHAEPNSAPDAGTDLRLVLRRELMEEVFAE
ncbi:MAG TPA: serine hydrolase domain-containing protein [Acidobacteriaceae bacterium]|nr:serine hydrolase domain-containing protein [Acidobacteriaceae bacterium]